MSSDMIGTAKSATPRAGPGPAAGEARPTTLLPMGHLARLSAYWLGLTAIDAAVGLFASDRLNFGGLVATGDVGKATALVGLAGAFIGIVVQPTVGTMSDYAVSRWGRRKPFIVVGSVLDVFFLLGIAMSNSLLMLAAFVTLLSFSTNIARGPFQGYVPDLVAAPQVGIASALVGLMQILGNIVGFLLVTIAIPLHQAPLALMAVAVVELVTMVSVVWRVAPGRPARPREGRSWTSVAAEAWGTDILRERSYVWLVASRFFFLMAGATLVNNALTYLAQSQHLDENGAAGGFQQLLVVVALANVVAAVPASRLSDRVGRKPIIYASCGIGAVGVSIVALAPSVPVALIGGALFGLSAGMFLAVDWALMTDIIPRIAAGRYMGLSNVATGASTPIAAFIAGFVLDAVNQVAGLGTGPRVAFLVGVAFYGVAAVLLRPVDPRQREEAAQLPAGAPAAIVAP